MLGDPGGCRKAKHWVLSLFLAATAVACVDEGPSVTTTGPDGRQAQGDEASATERVGDPSGATESPEALTNASRLAESGGTEVVTKPGAATTQIETDDAPTTSENSSDGDGSGDSSNDGDDDESDDPSGGSGSNSGGSNGPGVPDGEPGPGSLAASSVSYVNERRHAEGLGTLAGDPELTELADRWARQMISEQNLYHNPQLGSDKPARYGTIGENIAYSSNPSNIDDMWWNSDGHRANILGSSYTHIGVAFVEDDRGTTWAVQVFAG